MTTRPADLAVDAVACYRITRLLVADRITAPLRDAAIRASYVASEGADSVEDWEADSPHETWSDRAAEDPGAGTWLGRLLTCPWCTGVWVAIAVVAARRLAPRWWAPVAETASVAAAAGLLSGDR